MSKNLGFAWGAGGARGIAHIGFLQAMEEEGIKPDYIVGCSMGSVVGATYASGMSLERMQKAIKSLRLFDLVSIGKKGGLFDTKKVRELLRYYIGEITFDELQIPFHCVAVDMITQSLVEFSEGSVLDAVVASSSIPSVFRPTEKNGMRLIDGGILERVPAAQVKAMGADVVVAVDVLGQRTCRIKMPNVIEVMMETIDIMASVLAWTAQLFLLLASAPLPQKTLPPSPKEVMSASWFPPASKRTERFPLTYNPPCSVKAIWKPQFPQTTT